MLKVPEHQVAGRQAIDGKLGPLIDNSGHFYKPLQDDDERGTRELTFYHSFSSNTRIPHHIRRFFPVFHGTQLLKASDRSGLRPHLVLQDITSDHLNPSILDIKIGSRTWYLEASNDYIQNCFHSDKTTTTVSLGFRICGLQIYNESGFWKPGRKLVRNFTADDVRSVLRKFVSSNVGPEPDCCFAGSVYGGCDGILERLLELKTWFEDQTMYHFRSCSVLLLFDKESFLRGKTPFAEVKLIDFAHVVDGNGVIDHNFLGGLCSFIKFVSQVLADSKGSTMEDKI